jgi:hypothetical protein
VTAIRPPFPSHGFFVIADQETRLGGEVTFWGSRWSRENHPSGGPAPSSFKGFADGAAPSACGDRWTARPGNSGHPPDAVPALMAVIVVSEVEQDGSTISGDVRKVAIVQVDPGYGPSPGHAGRGRVVALVCG